MLAFNVYLMIQIIQEKMEKIKIYFYDFMGKSKKFTHQKMSNEFSTFSSSSQR